MATILIVDDEKPTRDVMARLLSPKYECLTAPDAAQALKILSSRDDVALVITDYKMPGDNGVELIKKTKALHPSTSCILITAFGEIELAVEAMKEGADDFLVKPITDIAQLEMRVAKAIKTNTLEKKVAELETRLQEKKELEGFTGSSSAMEKVYALIRKAAPSDANVLIEGPSGSGKEVAARAIHAASRRAAGPFVAVECSALPATLLETELFGSIKGAYTDARDRAGCFETADGGTIFLDEIGEIDASSQVKLLRVLETRTFQRVGETKDRHSDFRLVTATNKDLASLVAEGKFREDLYYRLNVIDLRMPPLKDRPGDVALLAAKFLKEFAPSNPNGVRGIDTAAMAALERYPWPGNVRQLRNAIEKMVVLSSGGKLTLDDVPMEIREWNSESANPVLANSSPLQPSPQAAPRAATITPPRRTIKETEKESILAMLDECRGNITRAAERLGISRRTIQRKLKTWAEH